MEDIRKIVDGLIGAMADPERAKKGKLMEMWPKVIGPRFAEHTKPVFGKKGELIVWVDQSVLAFELKQRYHQVLLNRLKEALGDDEIKSLRFYVGQIR